MGIGVVSPLSGIPPKGQGNEWGRTDSENSWIVERTAGELVQNYIRRTKVGIGWMKEVIV